MTLLAAAAAFRGVPSSSYGDGDSRSRPTPIGPKTRKHRRSTAKYSNSTSSTDYDRLPISMLGTIGDPVFDISETTSSIMPAPYPPPPRTYSPQVSNCKRVICCCLYFLRFVLVGTIMYTLLAAIIQYDCIANWHIDPIHYKCTCIGYSSSCDQIEMQDFALYYGGAQIIHADTSLTSGLGRSYPGARVDDANYHGPEKAIMQSMYVGECWAMEGSQGQIAIALITPITVTNITIQHLDRRIALDITTAPREMELWGQEANSKSCRDSVCTPVLLAAFTYNIFDLPIQTFAITHVHASFVTVVLKIKNNWNNRNHTCLYRVSIHGKPF